jgi:amino acid permease
MAIHADPSPAYQTNEKGAEVEVEKGVGSPTFEGYRADQVINESAALHRGLHGRHMQMIAIGTSAQEYISR